MTTVDVLDILVRVKDMATAGLAKAQLGMKGLTGGALASKGALIGLGAAAVGIGVTAVILKKSVAAAMDLEQAMANVSSVTVASTAELDTMKKAAIEWSMKTTVSAKEAADGMYFLASAGFDVNEIMSSLGPTIELAAGTQTDFSVAAGYAAKTLRAFGLEADSMGRVADVLQGTIAASQNTMETLGETMKYVAPIAKSAGMSLEETAAITAVLANAGIEGSLAGTTLRRSILNLQTPSAELKAEMKSLGLEVYNEQGQMRNMIDIFSDLETATGSMTQESKNYFMETLFGTRALAGMNIVTEEGSTGIREFADALEEGVRSTDKLGAATIAMGLQLDTSKSRTEILKHVFTGIGIVLGEELLPAIDWVIGGLQRFGNWLSDHEAEIRAIIGFIALEFKMAFKIIEIVITPVIFALGKLWDLLKWIGGSTVFKTITGGIVGAFEKFAAWEIPEFQTGGRVQQTGMALVHEGEEVIPAGAPGSSPGGGGATVIMYNTFGDIHDRADADYMVAILEERIPEAVRASPLLR